LAYIHQKLAQKGWPYITSNSWSANCCLLLRAGSTSWSPKQTPQILPDPPQHRASCEQWLKWSKAQQEHPWATAKLQLYGQHPADISLDADEEC